MKKGRNIAPEVNDDDDDPTPYPSLNQRKVEAVNKNDTSHYIIFDYMIDYIKNYKFFSRHDSEKID